MNQAVRSECILGVHSIDHVGFSVPDLSVAERFYKSFGLDVRSEGAGLGLYASGQPTRSASIGEAKQKQLSYLSFGIFEADAPRFRDRLSRLGVPLISPAPVAGSNGLWFRDPAGLLIELRVSEKSSPNRKPRAAPAPGENVRGAPSRSGAPLVHPRRLSHAMIFTVDLKRIIAFYSDVLGLRLTDRSGYNVGFMHGVHGSDHHMLGLVNSTAIGLHHTSWEVDSFNEVGLGAMQMAGRGFADGWGVGRHVLGSNYFHYVRDPWSSFAEYSAEIDFIPPGAIWEAGDHPPEDSFYVWGPEPPSDFTVNHEIK